jgi:hypothetical protein
MIAVIVMMIVAVAIAGTAIAVAATAINAHNGPAIPAVVIGIAGTVIATAHGDIRRTTREKNREGQSCQ